MASGNLGRLSVDLLLETAQWAAGLNKAEHQAEKFADAIEGKLNKMAGNIGEALKGLAAGFVAGFAVERVISFGNEVQKTADMLGELAQKTSISVGALARLSVHAELNGSNLEAMSQGMVKFQKSVVEAFNDPKSNAANVFRELGIQITDSNGKMRSTEELYQAFARSMGGVADGAGKTAAALEVAGKSAADLIPVWNGMATATSEAEIVANNYSKQMVALQPIADAFGDQLTLQTTSAKSMAAVIGREVIPYFTELVKTWTDASASGSSLGTVGTFLLNTFKGIVVIIDGVVTGLKLLVDTAIAVIAVLIKLRNLDLEGARGSLTDYFESSANTLAAFGRRVEALVNPMATVTTETHKMEDANDRLARAVSTVTKEKEKLYKINMALYGSLPVKAIEDEKVKLEDLSGEIIRKERERLREQEKAQKEYNDKLREEYEGTYRAIEGYATQAFENIFSNSKDGWRDMLKGMLMDFQKLVAQIAAKKLVASVLVQAEGGMGEYARMQNGGSPGISGGSGGGGMGDMVTGAYNWYSRNYGAASYAEGGANFVGPMPEGYTAGASAVGGSTGLFSTGASWSSGAGWGAGYGAVAGIAGGLIGGYGAGALGAGERGQAAGQQWGSTLATVGMMVGGPIGAAIGAVLGVVIGKATDPDPDAMRKAIFGNTSETGLGMWGGKSALGSFGFTQGEWLSDSDMGDTVKQFVAGITAMDNALAKFMSPEQIASVKDKLDKASKQYELGMEHGGVNNLGTIMQDRLAIITKEINESLGMFVEGFKGPVEDIVATVDAYLSARAGADFDLAGAIAEMLNPPSMMEAYQKGKGNLEAYAATLDTSAEHMNGLTQGMNEFIMATIQMVAAIDQAAASMHAMFQTTADSIRQSLMSEEERYAFLQKRSEELFAALLTETDPAKINDLATRINADINAAWGLLDEGQQSALGEQHLQRLTMLDETVADKMRALREVVIGDADTMMEDIADRLEAMFETANAAAATQQAAADQNLLAAQTPVQVNVVVVDDGSVTAAG